MLFLSVIVLEFYVLLIVAALVDEFVLELTGSTQDVIVALFFLFAVSQLNAGSLNRSRPQHIANMAMRAREGVNGQLRDFSLNIFWMRHCLAGMVRTGRDRSGRHFGDIIACEFNKTPEAALESPERRKMLAGIEMQMAWELANPHSPQQPHSSIQFCDAVALYKDDPAPSVGTLASLIVNQYRGLKPEVKTRLDAREKMSRLARIQRRITRGELLQMIGTIALVAPVILYLIAVAMGWPLPWG